MSYQKSVALLSCCLLFTTTFLSTALASTTNTPVGGDSGTPGVNAETLHHEVAASPAALLFAVPPDTDGPTITITPPNDVNLVGCYSDFTYSYAAMGKPGYTAYDECGTATITETITDTYIYCAGADDATPEGGLTIEREFAYEAVDCFGNTTNESYVQTITVTDNVAPSFVETLPADVTVDCSSIPAAATLTATDDCDSDASVSFSEVASTTCAGIVRTWVAVDDCGNSTTHIQNITVTDTDNPVIAGTPADINQTADAGDCGAIVTWTAPTATDNCTLDTFTSTHNSGDAFAVGTTTVTYTATDDCGNSTSTSFDITITDDEDPSISGMPMDISQSNDAGDCAALVSWTAPTAADNCGVTTFTSSHNSGASFAVGSTTVTYTATDAAGNSTSASFTVTVADDESPVLTGASDAVVECDGSYNTADWTAWLNSNGGATASDNCSGAVTWSHDYAGDCSVSVGDFNTYQQGGWGLTSGGVHDLLEANFASVFPSGVTVGCGSGYEIVFTSPEAIETYLPCTGDAEDLVLSHSGPNPTASSDPSCWNNALVSQILTAKLNAQFDAALAGFSASDMLLGDLVATSGDFVGMTVNDIISIADDVVGACSNAYTPNQVRAALNDFNRNYAGSNVDEGLYAPSACFYTQCAASGSATVTFTATDAAGNTSTTTATFTIEDSTAPTLSAQDHTLVLDATGAATLAEANVVTASGDDCGSVTTALSQTAFDCSHLGANLVTITVTDECGNETSMDVTVTVTDTEDPAIAGLPADITQGTDAGACNAVVTWSAPTASDNCGVDSFTSSHSSGDTFATGMTTVTYTATDAAGNQTTGSFTVTVSDDEDPALVGTPADIAVSTDPNTCGAVVNWTAPTATDNCGATVTGTHASGASFAVGQTTVTYTATDNAGNSVQESFTVTVTDGEAPAIANTPANISVNNDADACGAVVTWTAPSASDNCSVSTFTSTHNSGDSFPVGLSTVTYTATDAAGNTTSSSFTVTVTDNEAPSIAGMPADMTVSNDMGNCSAEVSWTTPTADDNCGIASFSSNHDPMDDFPVGTTTVTYTATDTNGNITTASFDITVTDGEAPSIAGMPADISLSNDASACAAIATWTAPTSADNCGVTSFTSTHSSGDSFPVGMTTVTYSATDAAGNTTTASFTVTVTDGENPTIAGMPADISLSNDAGVCGAAASWTAPTSADNCGVASFTSTHASGSTFGVGTTTVTYTATDAAGNTATASFNVVVTDDEDPVISNVPANISVTTDADQCGAIVNWTAPTASDNCSVTSFPSTDDSGDFFAVGSHTVSYSAMDAAGNAVTASFTVTVTDGEAPAISDMPADITVSNDAGQCGAAVTWAEPSSTDNCGVVSFSADQTNGASFPVGTTTVTYTAKDAEGNETTDSFDITVTDVDNPVFSGTPADITVNNDAGVCSAAVSWTAPTATDNCGATVTSTHNPGASFNVGMTTVTYTATDAANNSVTTSFTVTVVDNENPAIAGMPADISQTNDATLCGANVTWTAPTTTDNCGATLTSTHNPGDLFAVGTTTVTYTSTDDANNTATASFNVVVTDTEAPVIPAISTMTVSTDPGTCGAVVTFVDPAVTDNCAISTISSDIPSGSTFSLGTTTVTYTATDIHGNSSTASFDVIVEDNEGPTFGTPAADETVECDGAGNTAALTAWLNNNGGAAATDNCSGVTWSNDFTTMANTCGGAGAVQVIFTATDAEGNTTSTSATFTIQDTTAPTIDMAAADATVECDGMGNMTELNAWLNNNGGATASETCSNVSWSHNYGMGASLSDLCGATGAVTVTFTATDVCGNASTTNATFTIEDTTNPTAAGKDHTVTLDAMGNGSMVAADIDNMSSDGCGMVSLAASQTAFDCSHLGANTVTLTVTDECNNSATTTVTVTVEDTTNPAITAQAADATYECDGTDYSAQFTAWLANNGGATATDACGPLSWSHNSTGLTPDCGDSESETVTFTVTDGSGNTSTTTATFSVSDTTPPSIASAAFDVTTECDGAGNTDELNAWLLANGGAGEATDLCGDVTWSNNFHDFALTCAGSGEIEVIFTATDDCGNAATTTASFIIEDTTDPTLTAGAMDRTVECDGMGNTTDLNAWLDSNGGASAEELCGNITWTNDFTALSDECGATGSATVIFTASDDCGNSVTTSATYTIEDTTSPIALGTDYTAVLDANGQATITTADIDNGSYDGCGDVTLSLDVTSFDCDDVGPNAVTLTVTDECMNAASATVMVTVTAVDGSAPTLSDIPADITVNNDAGNCSAVVNYTMPTISDNCAGSTLASSHPSGSAFSVGTTTVTFTATDASGNQSTATFNVTVTDAEAPTFSGTPMDITQTNDMGDCGAAVTWTAPTADDNCGVTSVTSTHNPGDDFAVGTTTVTYTATDAAGLSTTTSFDVTVTDDEDPAIAGMPADITQTADADLCSAVVTYTAPTASDNCGVSTFTSTHNSGDTFAVGTTTVTYTATDAAGNTVSASFDVIITDNQSPAIADMPANITVSNDAGQCGAAVTWMAPSASDNCGVTSFTSTDNSGDTFPVGTTTVTYTAMDAAGNTTTASFDITITDDEAPAIASTPEDITQTNDAGDCSAAVTWTAPTASDNCAVTSFTSTHTPGATFAVGMTTVTYTAVDAAGNTTTSSFTVTVTDDELPSFAGVPADINQANDMGICGAVVTWTAPTADDNCGIASLTSTHNPGDTFAVGTTTVTYTATDIHGNVNTTSFDVDVDDTENPVFTTAASDLTVECDGMGNLTDLNQWLADFGGSVADDNCGVYSVINDYDVANMTDECGLTGATLVTFTATDIHGNTSTTSATFTIEDTTPPTFTPNTGSVTVECDGTGNVDDIDAWLTLVNSSTASDACGGITIQKTTATLTDGCAATGQASVNFLITDDCGNQVDTTLTFTIEDTTPPAFLTQAADMTVECDGAGNMAALQSWLDNHGGATADDVCGDFTWSNNFTALSDDCGATGSATVEFYATDECGNVATSTATFTIEDTTDPAIASPAMDMTVECDGLGNTTALNNWLAANGGAGAATDACGGVTWSNDFTALSDLCGATGAATVIFTATDDCGNTSTTSATFTIEDTTDPAIASAAMDMTVECDGSGNTAQLNAWLASNGGAGAASDACGGVTWSNDFTALSDLCGATGAATVIFTATDDCGNTSTTSATFTIEDTTVPSIDIAASDLTVECDGAGNPTELNDWLNSNGGASASDQCSGVTWSHDFTALSDLCGATGAATVTFTATDDCGLSSSTTATFTIEDTTAPVLTGDEVVIIDCAAWPWDPLYQPTIDELLTVVDTAGNPMITLDEACGYTNFPIDFGVMSGGCNYDHQLIYYPIDDCGNEGDSLYQVIQVDDYTEPTFNFIPADTMIACTEDASAYFEWATAIDACDPSVDVTYADEIIPTACPEEYTIRRTFYAEDCGYNIAEAVQTITIADTAAPALTLTAPADMALNGCLSSADISEAVMGSVTWSTSDDCGAVSVSYTTSDAAAYSCTADDANGEGSHVVTRTFTVTATDCAGNSTVASIDQTITITDNTAPTVSLSAPADVTVYLDASCYAAPVAEPVSGDASGFLVTASDDCDSDIAHTLATTSDDTTYTGIADGVGSYEILRTYTVTVTDDCGNNATATTSHTISVLDTISPAVTPTFPADLIVYADDENGYFDPTPLGTGGPSADYSDNCSGEGDQTYGVAGQVPTGGLIITAIADPNDAASTCRFVEIHNSGDSDIDLTGYALQRWTNGNSGPSTGSNIDLSSIGTLSPGEYAWIANNAGFSGCYGFEPTIIAGGGGPADSNGDDNIAIIDGASNIIDMFGVAGEDGSNTCHEFEDGVALRAGSNTDPNGGAWDESGWSVYSDGSSASGCTDHNSNQAQNASDIAALINNWAGASPAAPETDFNSVDISFSDVTTSYTATACYTFERTWTITVTDNNGNATTVTDVQTIQVADTSAPDITALENTTASCDLFGFDLSAGDQSSLVAGTSFELATSGSQYVDTGDASEDHALDNNAGQSDVNFTAAGGELGFASYYYATGSNGLTDGDFVGATGFTGVVGAFTDGSQGFQMQDTDGIMEVVFDNVDVSQGGVTLSIDYFPQSTGWETADRIRIWVVADGGEIDLVDTDYEDIDGLGIEGMWNTATLDLDGFDDVTLHVSLESNSGSEGLFIDNIAFTTGNSPLAALEAAGYVSFSDNVELASTEAAITLDGTPCEGAYDIVYTATDSCGNSATATQRIVLEDTEDPVLTVEQPDNVMMAAGADCNADYIGGVAYPMASATDNCDADVEITSYHVDSPKQYHCLPSTGSFTVLRTYTFTATDNCGNTHTVQVQHTVTVMDETAPTFTATAPADLTVNIDPFCGANTSTTIGGLPTVTDAADNCDATVDIDIDHTDGAPVYSCDGADGAAEGSYSFVRTFTITATDDCGNATVQTVTQTITALDITAPTITALAPMAAEAYTLDADCMADLTPTAMPVAAASDACDSDVALTFSYSDGAPNYTCDNGDGSAEGSFSFVRTWTVTATDDCGNMTTQQTNQTVVVTDDADPTLTPTWPADYTTDLDAECNADLTPAAAGAATATADDACDSDVAIEITSEDGAITYMAVNADDAAEGGYTFVRTWTITATDDCGNATTMTHDQTITANDVTAPAQTLETLPTYSVEGCYGDVDLDPSVTGTPMVTAEDGCDSQVDIDLSYSTDDMVFNQVVGNYSLVIDTISGPEEGVMGMTTVRMYIETENADDFISAVAGDEINPTAIRTTTAFYQNVLGGPTANNYNDGLTLADPLVAYDSFVTIGIDAQADGAAGEQETTVVGNWTAGFETGGDVLINDFFGGSWFTTSPNSAAVAGADHRVLLGQFTTDGQMSGQMFVQVFPNGLGAEEMRISFTFGECAEDDDTPEGSYAFTRRWESIVTDDANNQDTAVTYQHIQVLDTEAPQLTNTCGLENGEVVAYDCPGEGVLDFDPVPVACEVTAIDNCDSEVNVNVFTESEGYIPTDAIRNYCAPTTPEALNGAQTCDDRAPEVLRLFNFPGSDDSFVMADAENLIQVMSDGSMHIELEVENADGTGGFVFTADYGAGQDWATWSAGGSNYKKDCAEIYPGESIWEDWVYFLMTSGTLEGTGMYAGSSFTLSHQPANGYYGMQMGLGANNKNTNYGGSAWFFWQGDLVVDGTDMGPMASSGDVFMDLDCCLDWSVEYFYTALDDCGNPTGFHYSETMSGDLGQDDPAVSGGHTEGPVDITSIGGIKEPIRITGLAPNPTNNQSQLSFLVNENMRLRVDLYTMEGTLVQELYEGNAVTGVQYIMDIDADGLSAGMYQVRISSNTYLAVKKLLVSN